MAAYIITQITITDPEEFKQYVALSPASIKQYGGRHIARGARTITLEGEASTTRNGIIQFDSVDAALRWYNSPEYREVKRIRDRSSVATFRVLEGV